MNVVLTPELEHFVNQQVQIGHFSSPADVVEAALQLLRSNAANEDELDDETLLAIQKSDEQIARGQGRPWEEVREELKAKYLK